ncbi:MAG: DUF1206 domain-containing protein [Actinobacteria bacterium]|nr:DUF1206 domain-containing protein [Actinomycetota bacterium]
MDRARRPVRRRDSRGGLRHRRSVPRTGSPPFRRARGPGPRGALSALLEQPFFGNLLLGIVAVGLVAYGLLMCAVARYRRIASRDAL